MEKKSCQSLRKNKHEPIYLSIDPQKLSLEKTARTLKEQGICLDLLSFITGFSRKKVDGL